MKTRLPVCLLAPGLAAQLALPAYAQNYPAKPIRIVTSPAGGGNDFPARLIARALSGPLGQQIVVDNRATILIADIVRQAPLFEGIQSGAHCYFVHSYIVKPTDAGVAASYTHYGSAFVSSIRRDNVVACQFHPEKSQAVGLQVIKNFGDWK